MRNVAIGVVVLLLVAAGAGYFFLRGAVDDRLKAGLDQALQHLPDKVKAGYKSVGTEPATQTATIEGFTTHIDGDDPIDLAVDEIVVAKPALDLPDAWNKAVASPGSVLPETVLPVAAKLVAKNVHVHSADVDYVVKSIEIDNLRVYPWAALHSGISSVADLKAALKMQNPPTPEDVQRVLKLEAAVYAAIAVDTEHGDGITGKVSIPAQGDQPAVNGTFEVASVSAAGIDRGRMESAEIDGVKFDMGAQGKVALDKATITAFDMRAPLVPVLNGAPLTPDLLNGSSFTSIEYDGLMVHAPKAKAIKLGKFALTNFAYDKGVLTSAGFSLSGLRLTKEEMPTPESQEVFDQLGVEHMTISSGASFSWDVATQRVALRGVTLKVNELGTVDLAAEAANVAPGPNWADKASFAHATLHYTDASFVNRAFEAAGKQYDVPPKTLRKQIAAGIKQYAATLGDSPAIGSAADAALAFLAAPHNLTIELAPPAPVGLNQLKDATSTPPAQLATMLGLSVTANQ